MLKVFLVGIEPIYVVHGYDFIAICLWVVLEEVEGVDELVDVLETTVHAETASWGVGVSCVAS